MVHVLLVTPKVYILHTPFFSYCDVICDADMHDITYVRASEHVSVLCVRSGNKPSAASWLLRRRLIDAVLLNPLLELSLIFHSFSGPTYLESLWNYWCSGKIIK